MTWARRRSRRAGVAAAVLLAVISSACSPAAPEAPLPAGVTADQKVELFLGLARDQAGLQQLAAGVDPAARTEFLKLDAIAARFGSTATTRAAVSSAFPAGSVTFSATGGFARVVIPITLSMREFGLRWNIETVGDDRILSAGGTGSVPAALTGVVTEVLPQNSLLPEEASPPVGPAEFPADAASCRQAVEAGAALVTSSGLSAVHRSGARGAGADIAVVEIAPLGPTAFTEWLDCIGHPPVEVRRVQTGNSTVPGRSSAEAHTDMAALTLALPELSAVTVVEADAADWVGDALDAALTDPAGRPQTIVSSIVFCETQLTAAEVAVTEYVLAAAVASGTTVVAASGDHGSSACGPADTEAAVTYPASSPNVLSVGGVDGTGRVWHVGGDTAGGGGTSSMFPGRRLPDLAAVVSAPELPPIPVCDPVCRWQRFAGTSFAAPFVAGGLMAVDAALEAQHLGRLPLGLGTGDRTLPAAWFTDVTAGSNDLYGTGCCTATTGFDEASGHGQPRFDRMTSPTTP